VTERRLQLVTGGAGFLGSALVRRLVAAGHPVRVLDDETRGSRARLAQVAREIEFVRGDVRDADTVRSAARGVACAWHLACINGTRRFYEEPDRVLDVGLRGMLNLLDACSHEGVHELFLASSSEVYQTPPAVPTDEGVPLSIPDPHNPRYSYAAVKIASEMLALHARRSHLGRVVVFRPHNVYGPDMGWDHVVPELVLRMNRLARSQADPVRFPIQGTGEATRSFVYVDDAVEALLLLLERGEHGGIYNVGTQEELSIREVAHAVAECFGRRIELVPGPAPAGGTQRRCPDVSKLAALGFRPRVRFREGLAQTARWYEAHAEHAPEGDACRDAVLP
jgi:nucleoside-diphosphate-sugar epimerase